MNPTESQESRDPAEDFGFLEITTLVLSVYVLGALVAQTVFHPSAEVRRLLDQVDALVCVVFLVDFAVRFRRAPSKMAFMKWGWIDLVSSIPAYDFFRWGRVVRLIRIVRLLRAFRSSRHLLTFLYRHRARSLTLTALLSAFVVIIASSIAVLVFEHESASNIRTPFDAVWWAISTITTVGYGDKVPLTAEGKVVAMVLMVTGVALFGVLTGLFARVFMEPDLKKEDADIARLTAEIGLLRERIDRMEAERTSSPSRAED